jgi:transcriptional regulator with XRE-family HTH domain
MTCFAARLKQLRKQRGMTQTEVAAAIGVTRSVVSLYETEMRQPSPDMIVALARLYGVSTDYLLRGDNCSFVDVSGLSEQEIAAIVNMVGLLRSKK